MKDDRLYLLHISENLERIEEYVAEGKEAFFADRKTEDAVLRNLQTLAESSQRLSEPLKGSRSEIDWRASPASVTSWSMTIWGSACRVSGRSWRYSSPN